jgi:hypothetical protein
VTADPQGQNGRPDEGPAVPPTRPEGRYGPTRRPLPRPLLFALLGLAILAVVPLTVAVYDRLNPPVQADVLGWDISAEEVTVRVRVEKAADASATCTLEARDVDGELVGSRLLVIDDPADVVSAEETFPTAREAVTVEAVDCREPAADQPVG